MLDISLLFKIGGVSIIIIILERILKTCGRDDYAMMTNLAGIIIILLMVVNLVSKLFGTVRTMFQL